MKAASHTPAPFIALMESPIGRLELHARGDELGGVFFAETRERPRLAAAPTDGPWPEVLTACQQQLQEYFEGKRQVFNLPLCMQGTDFQKEIWHLLLDIPYGHTVSYLDLSRKYGDEKAIRAVGAANGANPLSIIVPCHRVIGTDGKLIGYGGDVWRKEWLLRHETQHAGVATGRLF